ncbi:MAG: BON domain-containing protein, partial [Gemmataceae bacterium]
VDGVVVVGGPVTEPQAAALIEKLTRSVPGVADVRVSTWTIEAIDPVQKLVAAQLKAKLPELESAPRPDPRLQAAVTTARKEIRQTVLLLDPEWVGEEPSAVLPAVYTPPPPPGPAQYPTIPPPAVPTEPTPEPVGSELQSQLRELQGRDRRYKSVDVSVADAVVTLTPHPRDQGEAWAFAAEVRKLKEVRKVVLRSGSR